MAVVFKNTYISNNLQNTQSIAYIDSTCANNYIEKMYDVILNYIKINTFVEGSLNKHDYIASNEKDIRDNKPDGLWIVSNEKNLTMTLFTKKTNIGYVYNDIFVEKMFVLICEKCQRIIPQNQKVSLSEILSVSLIHKNNEIKSAKVIEKTRIDDSDIDMSQKCEKSHLKMDFITELAQKISEHRDRNRNKDTQTHIEMRLQSNATKKNIQPNIFSSELANKVNQYRERNIIAQ